MDDAKLLFDASRFPGAYYLVGYSVECALKACIAKQIQAHDFPDKKVVQNSYTHDLQQLLSLSGVKHLFDANVKVNKAFEVNWTTVKDWTEESRYDNSITQIRAKDLLNAVTDQTSGVLTWLKTVW